MNFPTVPNEFFQDTKGGRPLVLLLHILRFCNRFQIKMLKRGIKRKYVFFRKLLIIEIVLQQLLLLQVQTTDR